MFIYNGKFNWLQYASNETITVVLSDAFTLNDPVSAYWQWTVDGAGNKKANVASSGVVQSVVTMTDGSSRIYFSLGYYSFDATITADYKTLTLTMHDLGGNSSSPFDLAAMHINPTGIPSAVVYAGRLDFLGYADSEMATLVVPYGIAEGAFAGLYFQWTVDGAGVPKANHPINATFQDVVRAADGTVTAAINDGFYTYSFTFSDKRGSFVMSNPKDGTSPENKFAVAYSL